VVTRSAVAQQEIVLPVAVDVEDLEAAQRRRPQHRAGGLIAGRVVDVGPAHAVVVGDDRGPRRRGVAGRIERRQVAPLVEADVVEVVEHGLEVGEGLEVDPAGVVDRRVEDEEHRLIGQVGADRLEAVGGQVVGHHDLALAVVGQAQAIDFDPDLARLPLEGVGVEAAGEARVAGIVIGREAPAQGRIGRGAALARPIVAVVHAADRSAGSPRGPLHDVDLAVVVVAAGRIDPAVGRAGRALHPVGRERAFALGQLGADLEATVALGGAGEAGRRPRRQRARDDRAGPAGVPPRCALVRAAGVAGWRRAAAELRAQAQDPVARLGGMGREDDLIGLEARDRLAPVAELIVDRPRALVQVVEVGQVQARLEGAGAAQRVGVARIGLAAFPGAARRRDVGVPAARCERPGGVAAGPRAVELVVERQAPALGPLRGGRGGGGGGVGLAGAAVVAGDDGGGR
jgi:hypothetical protein